MKSVKLQITSAQCMTKEGKFKGFLHVDLYGTVKLDTIVTNVRKFQGGKEEKSKILKNQKDLNDLKPKCKQKLKTKIEKYIEKGYEPKGSAFTFISEEIHSYRV